MKQLYFITSNAGKLTEAAKKLHSFGFIVEQKNLGYPEIQTDSLIEVVTWGINHIQKRFDKPFMVEDAGLFIEALGNFPGVYSKYVFFTIGLPGILRLLESQRNRKAVFRSVYGYKEPGNEPVIAIGECAGCIAHEQRGTNGFGYDPIFITEHKHKTFGEMTPDEKNRFSHRAKALEKLMSVLK
jgi:XTP/dITP diphosphohydrolase